MPFGTTIGQAIEEEKKFEAERKRKEDEEAALKKKLQEERAAAAEKISKAVTVTLIEKGRQFKNYDPGRFDDRQIFRIGVKNTSDKALEGVSGRLVFVDIFDKEVGSVGFKISETIKPGQDYVWVGSRRYNEFDDEQRAVWNLENDKFKTRFEPGTVVFTDGTKLVADAN